MIGERLAIDYLIQDRPRAHGRSNQACSRRCQCSAAGFGLLEVVVALVIATLALGVLFEALSDALHLDVVATQTTEAVIRARSHLAMALADEAPVPGEQEGDDGGGFRWHVRYETLATDRATDDRPAATLYAVSVRITWERGGGTSEVRLASECLGRPGPQ
jgi:general secretion pathway protein I